MILENEILGSNLYRSEIDLISNKLIVSSAISKTLIALADDAYCNLRLYQEIFLHQPQIIAKIIKLSSFEKNTDSLIQAISILGWKKIRGIVSTICLFNAKNENNSVHDLVWQQCCLRTILARLISKKITIKKEEIEDIEKICYFLGLGKMQIAAFHPQEYKEVIEMIREGSSLNEAEQTRFGYIGYDLSYQLCVKAGLPQNFSEPLNDYMGKEQNSNVKKIIALSELLSSSIIYQYEHPEQCKYLENDLGLERMPTIIIQALKDFKLTKKISGL